MSHPPTPDQAAGGDLSPELVPSVGAFATQIANEVYIIVAQLYGTACLPQSSR